MDLNKEVVEQAVFALHAIASHSDEKNVVAANLGQAVAQRPNGVYLATPEGSGIHLLCLIALLKKRCNVFVGVAPPDEKSDTFADVSYRPRRYIVQPAKLVAPYGSVSIFTRTGIDSFEIVVVDSIDHAAAWIIREHTKKNDESELDELLPEVRTSVKTILDTRPFSTKKCEAAVAACLEEGRELGDVMLKIAQKFCHPIRMYFDGATELNVTCKAHTEQRIDRFCVYLRLLFRLYSLCNNGQNTCTLTVHSATSQQGNGEDVRQVGEDGVDMAASTDAAHTVAVGIKVSNPTTEIENTLACLQLFTAHTTAQTRCVNRYGVERIYDDAQVKATADFLSLSLDDARKVAEEVTTLCRFVSDHFIKVVQEKLKLVNGTYCYGKGERTQAVEAQSHTVKIAHEAAWKDGNAVFNDFDDVSSTSTSLSKFQSRLEKLQEQTVKTFAWYGLGTVTFEKFNEKKKENETA